MLERFKEKWGLKSNVQLLLIFIVFSITGTLAVKLGKPILSYLNIRTETLGWFYYVIRLLGVFALYQIVLPIVGALFGQSKFFYAFQKKSLGRIPVINKLFKK